MSVNVQSVVTNGAVKANGKAKVTKVKAIGTTSLTAVETRPMTLEEACEIGFKAGEGLASLQDSLALALTTFRGNTTALAAIRLSMVHGYMVRDLGYTREHAVIRANKKKHNPTNPKLWDDDHRNTDEERCVTSVGVMWYRANQICGTNPQDTPEKKAEREANAAAADAKKKAKDAAYEIVHPKPETDVYEAMTRLVSTMTAYMSKHSAQFKDDRGMAWRDWLKQAPKA